MSEFSMITVRIELLESDRLELARIDREIRGLVRRVGLTEEEAETLRTWEVRQDEFVARHSRAIDEATAEPLLLLRSALERAGYGVKVER